MDNTSNQTIHKMLSVSSIAFDNRGSIPAKYTCDGMNVNPPLSIAEVPAGVKSLAIVVDDPDAPSGTFTHWVMWNIPPNTTDLREKEAKGEQGMNSFNHRHYDGPCPPHGTHRYFFKVYGLDTLFNLPDSAQKEQLEKAMEGHIMAFGQLIGLYKR